MRQKILLFSIFFICFSSYSQKWIEVTKDKFGNKYYIKSSIVSKGGNFGNENVIKIWTKQTVKKISDQRSKSKGKVYTNAYMLELMEFDCQNSQSKLLSRTVYSAQGGVIGENNIDPNFSDWQYVVPDSVGETLLEKVCELYN